MFYIDYEEEKYEKNIGKDSDSAFVFVFCGYVGRSASEVG
jgi:hypothetical protein